jgi:hypothetical protein
MKRLLRIGGSVTMAYNFGNAGGDEVNAVPDE